MSDPMDRFAVAAERMATATEASAKATEAATEMAGGMIEMQKAAFDKIDPPPPAAHELGPMPGELAHDCFPAPLPRSQAGAAAALSFMDAAHIAGTMRAVKEAIGTAKDGVELRRGCAAAEALQYEIEHRARVALRI